MVVRRADGPEWMIETVARLVVDDSGHNRSDGLASAVLGNAANQGRRWTLLARARRTVRGPRRSAARTQRKTSGEGRLQERLADENCWCSHWTRLLTGASAMRLDGTGWRSAQLQRRRYEMGRMRLVARHGKRFGTKGRAGIPRVVDRRRSSYATILTTRARASMRAE